MKNPSLRNGMKARRRLISRERTDVFLPEQACENGKQKGIGLE
jgi:hypothetical protein